MKHLSHRTGFTLVEISIVLVLIGLIVGGILVGNDVLSTTKLNSIITEYQKYRAAVVSFKEKYDALPGDMADATSYWGTINGVAGQTCPSGYNATRKTLTCDGDGDDKIGTWMQTGTISAENARAWQHMNNAGFINVPTTGLNSIPSTYNPIITWGLLYFGVNDENANIYIWPFVKIGSDSGYFDYGHVLVLGYSYVMEDETKPLPRINDVHLIDNKMDDGIPYTGNVRTMWRTDSITPNPDPCGSSAYTGSDSSTCAAIFITGF